MAILIWTPMVPMATVGVGRTMMLSKRKVAAGSAAGYSHFTCRLETTHLGLNHLPGTGGLSTIDIGITMVT